MAERLGRFISRLSRCVVEGDPEDGGIDLPQFLSLRRCELLVAQRGVHPVQARFQRHQQFARGIDLALLLLEASPFPLCLPLLLRQRAAALVRFLRQLVALFRQVLNAMLEFTVFR